MARPTRHSGCLVALAACACMVCATEAPAQEWTCIDGFEGGARVWTDSAGPGPRVRVTDRAAHGGLRSLALGATLANAGRSIRVSCETDIGDLQWSLESRVRFWLRGDERAQMPHGGWIFVEAHGGPGGADSHWMLDIPGDTYRDPSWHAIELGPVSTAHNPDWAPDADGRPEPRAFHRIILVAQQEAPPELNVPFTFVIDDVEATHVKPWDVRHVPARMEDRPDHVTPIGRGFTGRRREHPATVTFEDASGWLAGAIGPGSVELVISSEEPCYEDLKHQAKVTYSSPGGPGVFELVPPRPIPIRGEANAACAWVYGNNWSWMPDPGTPPVTVWVRVIDATGQRHRINMGVVNYRFYGMLHKRLRDHPRGDPGHRFAGGASDGRIHAPASVEAIEIHGGTNPEPRTIYIESVSLFRDDMPLPAFRPELVENLPFPTTPDTILPPVAKPTRVSLERQGEAYVFTLEGDERIVGRYTPRTGTLTDLSVQVGDREPYIPCAGAGPAFDLGGDERDPEDRFLTRQLVAVSPRPGAVTTRWRVGIGGEWADYSLTLRAKGKSFIVDWSSEGTQATALRLGHASGLKSPRLVRIPYMAIYGEGPAVLLDDGVFTLTLLDWYQTGCSALYPSMGLGTAGEATMNGGSLYGTRTDGKRNPLRERQFISVSTTLDEVLPTIPNPPSDQAEVLRSRLYTHLGGTAPSRFDDWLAMWRQYHRRGIRNLLVTHHEDAWTNGADVGQGPQEYTMCIEAAPEVGDDTMRAYCRAMRAMGYYVGLYENFTDYNPLGKSWDERNAGRNAQGELVRVWPPTYAIRPLKALEMARDYPRRVHAKFGCNTAYRDCHTAYTPWGQVDYQAGAPGAGLLSANFRAWGALLMDGSDAYGGPVFSEGLHHWFSAGLVDGSYGQINMPSASEYPLLLDFDLRRLHVLGADISMTPGWNWGRGVYHCLAATIAYGHMGFQPFGDTALAGRYYYLMQQLQSRYVMIPATQVLYHHAGRMVPISEALKQGDPLQSQVRVTYANGLEVYANCNPTSRWPVEVGGQRRDLSPDSWAAVLGDEFEEYCTEVDGVRIGYVRSPAYLFADGGGTWHDFAALATDGAVAVLADAGCGREVVPFTAASRIIVATDGPVRVEALDESGRLMGVVPSAMVDGRVAFVPVDGAVSYRLRPRGHPGPKRAR
ncbi:MAG TPA: hypothetical protein PLD23_12550 [Armatimonadota bacterium]|nr:hypothetical protein [Armatimonadota bacterium]